MNLVRPVPGFLAALRAECDRVGALLIFDEVITGFRLATGGAEEYFVVTPDIWCFGKVIGGGLPVGAFGARAKLLENLAPTGPVYQAGTLSGNPLATAAGLTVLSHVTDTDYEQLAKRAQKFASGLVEAIVASGVNALSPVEGPLVGLFLARDAMEEPTNFTQAKRYCENGLYPRFFHAMLERNIALAPGAYEILFVSMAHTDADLERTIEEAGKAAKEIAKS
jgi:glutamate-1-semialdehyde 2,1-aminomutase